MKFYCFLTQLPSRVPCVNSHTHHYCQSNQFAESQFNRFLLLTAFLLPKQYLLKKKTRIDTRSLFSYPLPHSSSHNKSHPPRSFLNVNLAPFASCSSTSLQTMNFSTDGQRNDNNVNNVNEEMMATIRSRKQSLRKQIRSDIRNMEQTEIDRQSDQIWSHLFSLKEYQDARSVALFLSMPKGEIHTYDACTRVLVGDGKQLFVPRVGLDFESCDMEMYQVPSFQSAIDETNEDSGQSPPPLFCQDWPRNKWGIPEPPIDKDDDTFYKAQPGDIDVIIVPGLAFDQNGGRLGQGKGYYDRFIAKMRETSSSTTTDHGVKPILIAVALDASFQSSGTIPTLEHDFQMDMIITPEKVIRVSKN